VVPENCRTSTQWVDQLPRPVAKRQFEAASSKAWSKKGERGLQSNLQLNASRFPLEYRVRVPMPFLYM
jgi:hypothetical protein